MAAFGQVLAYRRGGGKSEHYLEAIPPREIASARQLNGIWKGSPETAIANYSQL